MVKIRVAVLSVESEQLEVIDDFEYSLENMQEVVGGYIEAFDIHYDAETDRRITVWLNEEGKLIPLQPNFAVVRDERLLDIIMGDVLITAVDHEGETVGLTDEDLTLIKRKFNLDSFFIIHPIPVGKAVYV